MHDTAFAIAGKFFEIYWKPGNELIVELGAYDVNGSIRNHQPVGSTYLGVDLEAGPSVDIVMESPSKIPLPDGKADCVVSSSCFEHDKFFWRTFLELCRITKPGGYIYINVPSNGSFHRYPADYWRFYPDAGIALAEWATTAGLKVTLIESFVANRLVHQWNDFVAVFQRGDAKPRSEANFLSHHFSCQNVYRFDLESMGAYEPLPEDMRLLESARTSAEQVSILQQQLSESQERIGQLAELSVRNEALQTAYITLQNEHAHHSRLLAAHDETLLHAKALATQAIADLERERSLVEQLTVKENDVTTRLQAAQQKLLALSQERIAQEQNFAEKLFSRERELTAQVQQAQKNSFTAVQEAVARERFFAEKLSAGEAKRETQTLALRQEINQLSVVIAERDARLDQINQRIGARERQIIELGETLRAIQRTVSWRITAPLRSASSWFGVRKSTFRFVELNEKTEAANLGTVSLQLGQALANPNSRIIDMPFTNTGAVATNFDELMSFHDERFVHSAYHILLGREPDPDGGRFFLASVRSGISKMEILAQIRFSKEGKSRPVQIAALNNAIQRHRRLKMPLIGALLRLSGANAWGDERQSLRAIENKLYLLEMRAEQRFAEMTWLIGQLKSLSSTEELVADLPGKAHGQIDGKTDAAAQTQEPKWWGVMATPHTLFIAHLVAKRLRVHGWSADILTEAPRGFPHDMYVVICPQMFKTLPPGEKRIAYQMEQSVSSRWFTDAYIHDLENSRAVIDYALVNVEFMAGKGLVYPHIHYVPVGADPDYANGFAPAGKGCDVLFYGDANSSPRRRTMLDALKRTFNVRECSEVFGVEMIEAILSARLVINLHYYENALLEMPRIQECLSLGVPIVSESAQDQADYPECSGVTFFEQGSENAMIDAVRATLAKPPSKNALRESANKGSQRFAFMFDRFLIAQGCLPPKLAQEMPLTIDVHAARVALSMPETIARRRAFSKNALSGYTIFDGFRLQPGWVGCGLSYSALAKNALKGDMPHLTILEDDVLLPADFGEKIKIVHSYLEHRSGDWDIFAGVIADLHPRSRVLHLEDYQGIRFVTIDKMTSMVYNIYSKKALEILASWNPDVRDNQINTIDRYLERQVNLRVIVALPFLVGHREEMHSTLWGFQNTQYSNLIAASEKALQVKVWAFMTAQNTEKLLPKGKPVIEAKSLQARNDQRNSNVSHNRANRKKKY